MKKRLLTPEQAFQAMSVFLERYYARLGEEAELGGLLGDLQIDPSDGKPIDPAAWEDWLSAVHAAIENSTLESSGQSTHPISQQRKHR